jgi:large subunit ribosomal protein L25
VNIELDHKDLFQSLRNEKFHASILTLKLNGSAQQVLLRAVNMHPFKLQVQHVDFQRVSKDKKIHMKVPLHFVNADKSPGVKEQGGIASHVLNELDIVCFPDDLPEFIEVDLSGLTVGHSLHVRELALPKGVELALSKAENPVVATVVIPSLVTEEEEAAPAISAADVPTTEQAAAPKEGEAAAEADKAKAAEKPAAADKGEKKEKK